MSSNDDALDLVSDLDLTLDRSSRSIQGSLNDESGVGANATSRAEMTYVADPLPELVWSPHKGLSLRCAIDNVPEKNSSIFLGAGPSDMVYFPPNNIATETNKDELAEERNSVARSTTSPVEKDDADSGKSETSKPDLGPNSGPSEKVEKMNTSSRINNAQDIMVGHNSLREEDMACQGLQDGRTRNVLPTSDEFDLNTRPVELMPGGLNNMKICGSLDLNEDNGQTHPVSLIKGKLLQEVHDLRKSNATDALMLNPPSLCKGHIQSNTGLMEEGHNKMAVCALPLERLEKTAENKVQPLVKFISDSAVGGRNSLDSEKQKFQLEPCEVSKASPIRTLASGRKGKEKIVFDSDMNERALAEDCNSYGSAESCNSARLLGIEKRRALDFEEQDIAGRERVKLQLQETPGSTSFTGSDGSFMNWISTLIKGLSRPNNDRAPSSTDASNGNKKKGLITCSREQDNKCGNRGFQSLFQSLRRSNPKGRDQRLLISDHPQTSECCRELELAEEPIGNINSVRTSGPDDGKPSEQKMVSNESLNQSVLAGGKDPLTHSSILKGSVASVQFDGKTSALYKRFSSAQNSAVEGEVGNSEFIFKKQKTDSCGGNGFGLSFEEKLADDSLNERNQLSCLWMSHFCPKSSKPITTSADCKQAAAGVSVSSMDLSRLVHNPQINVDCFKDRMDIESQGHSSEETTSSSCKKLHSFPLEVEVGCAVKRTEGQKVNPIVHSQRLKYSEAMASIFGKRLNALNHLLPTALADKATSSFTTCFFCGIVGHDLQDCPQMTETEVDELLENITTFDEAEESPSLCIRCFQLNHWAVACPHALSVKKSWAEHGVDVPRVKAGCASSPGCYKPPRISTSLDVNLEVDESSECMRKISSHLEKVSDTRGDQNASEAPCFSHPCSSLGRQVLERPRGIFEAVKSLRLSRTDILKWMYSAGSISHLDGYYLRLRLGKLGEDLGHSGYYVACISGLQGEKSAETLKEMIPVIVGGIRYSVENQYISNQDFLEDELMSWWSTMVRGGGMLPLEDELWSKVEERKRLGL